METNKLAIQYIVVPLALLFWGFPTINEICKFGGKLGILNDYPPLFQQVGGYLNDHRPSCYLFVGLSFRTQPYLQHPWNDIVDILYSDDLLWWADAGRPADQIAFWLWAKVW